MTEHHSKIYSGTIFHKRLRPFVHAFTYRFFALYLDLDEAPTLDQGSRWFGFNRRAIMSFDDKDHGARDGSPLLPWVRSHLANAGLSEAGHSIRVLCFPRILGYVFNPLSVYFCFNDKGQLGALLYEVKNTFGDQHGYLFPIDTTSEEQSHSHACAKEFYVSPFMPMQGSYQFTTAEPDERLRILIRHYIGEDKTLQAAWNGQAEPWTRKNLRDCFWGHPLMTFKIITNIHLEAIKIWVKKRSRFYHRPAPPISEVTYIGKDFQDTK